MLNSRRVDSTGKFSRSQIVLLKNSIRSIHPKSFNANHGLCRQKAKQALYSELRSTLLPSSHRRMSPFEYSKIVAISLNLGYNLSLMMAGTSMLHFNPDYVFHFTVVSLQQIVNLPESGKHSDSVAPPPTSKECIAFTETIFAFWRKVDERTIACVHLYAGGITAFIIDRAPTYRIQVIEDGFPLQERASKTSSWTRMRPKVVLAVTESIV